MELLYRLLDDGYEVRLRAEPDQDEDGSFTRYEAEAWRDGKPVAATEGTYTRLSDVLDALYQQTP